MTDEQRAIPEWVTRGKTIRELIQELNSFEDQDCEVHLSLDYGETHRVISLVERRDGCCILANAEGYYEKEWQAPTNEPGIDEA